MATHAQKIHVSRKAEDRVTWGRKADSTKRHTIYRRPGMSDAKTRKRSGAALSQRDTVLSIKKVANLHECEAFVFVNGARGCLFLIVGKDRRQGRGGHRGRVERGQEYGPWTSGTAG